MKILKRLFFLLMGLVWAGIIHAQQGKGKTAFGETMRGSGRIYVVVAVLLTILIGLIIYLVRLDRKMTRLEKEQTSH